MGAAPQVESVVVSRLAVRARQVHLSAGADAPMRLHLLHADGLRVTAPLTDEEAVQLGLELLDQQLAIAGAPQEGETFADCPPGPFLHAGVPCFKSRYLTVDPFVMATGEIFWGGTTDRIARDRLWVRPVRIIPTILTAESNYARN